MGVFDFFRQRAEPISLRDALVDGLLEPDAVTLAKAMNIPAFAGCVNLICNTVSLIPMALYERKERTVVKVESDQRVALINGDTKDTLTGADFKKAMVYDYLTGKGGYAFINWRGSRWRSIHYVETSQVGFMESQDPIFKDYKILVYGRMYEGYQFVKMIRRTKNGYSGTEIVDENRELLATAYNSMLLENKMVKKGGRKGGYLQSERKLSQDAVDRLREAFNRLYDTDKDNAVVLNDGVKFQEASNTAVELQLSENKKQNGADICKLFGVPLPILNGGATREDWMAFVQYAIVPVLQAFADALNRDLLLEKEKEHFFWAPDIKELTKADIKTRYAAYETAYKTGWLQLDEIRAEENLPAIGMKYIKLGLQDVLLDPKTGSIYTPNTGMWGDLNDAGKMTGKPAGEDDRTEPDGGENLEKEGEEIEDHNQG